ncbi:MAG: peptide chain release factor 2 [Planctomycetes bacterium]|nr:peptide chain release factor 2 [Planctomycetota bacterium]
MTDGSPSSEDLAAELAALRTKLRSIRDCLDVPVLEKERAEIEVRMAAPGFWNDLGKSRPDIERLKILRSRLDPLARLDKEFADFEATLELAREAGGEELLPEAARLALKLRGDVDRFDLEVTFSGKYDHVNAYLLVQAGTGGTESCDWARMLVRMYTRFGEQNGFKVTQIDSVADDTSGGLRSATLQVEGPYAYGWLRAENGVHRLIRISPFDANARRQTSFASVDASPIIEDEVELEIDESQLRIDKFRAGGAGGQHVNKTESAVRVTHLPTGIVVQCQNERSQHMNLAACMKMLKAKLITMQEEKREAELKQLSGEKTEIGFGHQIRTYTFQPYQLVKDHRTSHESGNVDAVMDGDIGGFLEAHLRAKRKDGNKKEGERAADGRGGGPPAK